MLIIGTVRRKVHGISVFDTIKLCGIHIFDAIKLRDLRRTGVVFNS